ncbi:arfaptin-2, partial [Spodoptera litura]|uniref:Arfaptin-2 n=1 Tax=Spodoptera litura TaxID=69820 RepID=A0A9J7DNZ0_SPOLT
MSKWQSERSIHEMLKDTPPLRESSDSITSGTEAKFPTSRSMPFPPAYAPPDVSQNGAGSSTLLRAGSSKLDAIRNWGVSTYKCTKQILYEKLGKSSRTVDTELEAQIEMLRETQRKYAGVLRLSGALTSQLAAAAGTQRALGECFAELAQKSPELQTQFLYNADTQRTLTRNADSLLAALHFFNNSLATLTHKTIEDTLLTIRQYEAARVEYDAYRSELEASGGNPPELLLANIERHRRHYERLRDDSAVKLKLLHENRVSTTRSPL